MPLTPFVGLSVLVHIIVIIGHKLFNWTPRNKTDAGVAAVVRFTGFAIVVFVFGVILTAATFLVHASIEDDHSSIRFATQYIASMGQLMRANAKEAGGAAILPAALPQETQQELAIVATNKIRSTFNISTLDYSRFSVLDYWIDFFYNQPTLNSH